MKTEDFRITQYALGELHGKDREEFERELAASEELQQELEQTIALCDRLNSLPKPQDTLTSSQRSAIFDEYASSRKSRFWWALASRVVIYGGTALVLISLSLPAITSSLSKASPETLARLKALREFQQRDEKIASAAFASSAPAKNTEEIQSPIQNPATPIGDIAAAATQSSLPMEAPAMVAATTLSAAAGVPDRLEKAKDIRSQEVAVSGRYLHVTDSDRSFTIYRVVGDSVIFQDGRTMSREELTARSRSTAQTNHNTEAYDAIEDNPFRETKGNELSTFSIDVDTASYANVRRFLQSEQLPPAGAVRIEELVNYFGYDYPQPTNGQPFSVNVEVSKAPWAPQHELVRIALKGLEIPKGDRGPANLVFLIDVSGSMQPENKLPLLKRSLKALVENLAPDDRVAIVVYAGSSGLVLPSTSGKNKTRILEALDNLEAGGSTNGAQGITLAYQTARENLLKGGNNRVILCTDGDFNVGVTNQSDLTDLIERERASGVFLSVLGFGEGNLKDSTMEKLADKGNGNYAYIDSFTEGRKVLVEQMNSTLFTIAKDVKVQVEFNPARVAGYRLIGYENRILAKEDFNDDRKDAGEIGAGHTVTALYEVVPTGQPLPNRPSVDPLKYSEPSPTANIDRKASGDLLTVKLRYKAPDGDTSKLIEVPVKNTPMAFDEASPDFQFAAAVAAFGMKLRNSPYAGDLSWSEIQKIARRNLGEDPGSYRAEFLTLIEKAARLQPEK